MTAYLRAYSDVADTGAATTLNASYATARNLTKVWGATTSTTQQVGQDRTATPTYACYQLIFVFDTSTLTSSVNTGSLSFNVSAVPTTLGDTFEARGASGLTGMVAGDSLAAQTPLYGTLAFPSTTGRKDITLTNVSSMARGSGTQVLLNSQNQRTATAPTTSGERVTLNMADVTGTTSDPYLNTVGGWSFVGVGTNVVATATPLTLTEPAGVASGDLLIACIASRTTATTAPTATGWTAVNSQNNNNTLTTSSAIASGAMLYQVRGASAPTLAFTLPATVSVAMGQIVAYRGNAATTPLDKSSAITMATGSANITGIPNLQPLSQDDDLIVGMAAGGQEAAWSSFFDGGGIHTQSGATDTTSAPSTTAWFERADNVTTSGADTSLGIFDTVWPNTGTVDLAACNVTASVSAGHVGITAAFKIAAAGPTAYTLPAAAGSYALTGTAASLERGRETLALAGAYALTGQPATLTKSSTVNITGWSQTDKTAGVTLSGDDWTADLGTAVQHVRSVSTHAPTAKKYYAEFQFTSVTGAQVGVASAAVAFATEDPYVNGASVYAGDLGNDGGVAIAGVAVGPTFPALVNSDTVCMAIDFDNDRAWFRINGGNWNGSGTANPATNTDGYAYAPTDTQALFTSNYVDGTSVTLWTYGVPFNFTVPSGFLAWQPPATFDLAAVAGSYALSGSVASLEYGREILALGGSYAVTGTVASLELGREVLALPGSYALSGTVASLERGREVAAVSGSYSLTGTDATLTKGAAIIHRTLPADVGSYALSGQPTSLELGREVLATGGSYALTGQATSLEYGREALAVAGTYSLTGQAATFRRAWLAAAVSGSYSLAGQPATFRRTWKTTAVAGSYALTGLPVNLLKPGAWAVIGLPGAYALSGQPTSLELGREVLAVSGSYNLTGQAATLTKAAGLVHRTITATAGSYALTGGAGAATGPSSSQLVSYTPGTDRNDFTGEVGVRLGIGASNIPITWIGARRHSSAQTGTHTVKLYEWFGDTVERTVTIDYTGVAVGSFAWTAIAPYTLLANGYYALVMQVTAYDGQTWCNPGTTSFTGMVNVYDCYRVPASALATGTPNDMFIGLDIGSGSAGGAGTSLLYGREALALPGSYALSGVATSLEKGREVLAVAGSYAVSGAVATLTKSTAAVTGQVGVWTGSAWTQKPAKVWNGSAWTQKPVKHWTGSAWL